MEGNFDNIKGSRKLEIKEGNYNFNIPKQKIELKNA